MGVLGEDDGTVILDPSGQIASIVYPLPTFVNVKQIIYSSDLDRIFWLLHSGSLCKIRKEKERGVLEKVLKVGDIKVLPTQDTEGRSILAAINCMKLARHVPPRYDFEATIKTISPGSSADLEQFQGLLYPSRFFILSVGRGLVMFVPLERPELVYTKISVNRETVVEIEELQDPKMLVLLTENSSFLACSYASPTLETVLQINVMEAVTCLRVIDPRSLYVAYNSGETHIWEWKSSTFYKINENKSQVHSGPVTKALIEPSHNLIISTAGTEFIKFWSLSNVLLKEIRFPSAIADILYCSDLQVLLVAHGKVISRLDVSAFPTCTDVDLDVWMQLPPEVDVSTIAVKEDVGRREVHSSDPSYLDLRELEISRDKKASTVDGDSEMVDVLRMYDEIKQKSSSRSSFSKSGRRKRKIRKKLPKLDDNSSPQPKYRDLEKLRMEAEHLRNFRKEYIESISKPLQPYLSHKAEQQPVFLTRRQLTEEKIVANIQRYGDPADRPDVSGLRVVAEESALKGRGLRDEL